MNDKVYAILKRSYEFDDLNYGDYWPCFLSLDKHKVINKFNEIVDFLAGIDTTDDTLYNTLQSINTSINDISSRLHDIDSSWNNYYTKDEIDDTIEVVNASIINTDSSIVTINEKLLSS